VSSKSVELNFFEVLFFILLNKLHKYKLPTIEQFCENVLLVNSNSSLPETIVHKVGHACG